MATLEELFGSAFGGMGGERTRLQQLLESGIEAQRLGARGAGDIQLAEQKFQQAQEARRRAIERKTAIQTAEVQGKAAQKQSLTQLFTFALALGLPKAFNLLKGAPGRGLPPSLSLCAPGTGFGTLPRTPTGL